MTQKFKFKAHSNRHRHHGQLRATAGGQGAQGRRGDQRRGLSVQAAFLRRHSPQHRHRPREHHVLQVGHLLPDHDRAAPVAARQGRPEAQLRQLA